MLQIKVKYLGTIVEDSISSVFVTADTAAHCKLFVDKHSVSVPMNREQITSDSSLTHLVLTSYKSIQLFSINKALLAY